MDQTTRLYASSSSSSSYQQQHPPKTIISTQPSYHNSIHLVRKSLQKRITKPFIAPLPPTPTKVYNVDSSNFKKVVRVLTSTPEFQYPSARRLKDIAPPPLILSTIPKPSLFPKPTPPSKGGGMVSPLPTFMMSPDFCNFLNETLDTTRFTSKTDEMDHFEGLSPVGLGLPTKPGAYDLFSGALMSPVGFNLSPTSLSWCSSILLSPENLSSFNQTSIL
ncbi:uncharacterized protein LOC112515715 [Cynara cardunculus var. scolymus]|uniref:uncharacterized protein LOC112515715 n=1 Tax=Cynara cardunculus var. scolymus TaxID=59895 RepID=UPI000D6250F3|nr:uncharacterized protein LOC112515715 [Cynara cardunculus var. scolymus]